MITQDNIDSFKCCCFTGHRPEKLRQSEPEAKQALDLAIREAIEDGFTTFITGMARGIDIWAAQVVLKLREVNPSIKLVAAVPFRNMEHSWYPDWRRQFTKIIEQADDVEYVCSSYSIDAYQKRNEWMVDRASRVIAFYNGEAGGTKNCLKYAEKQGVEIVNLGTDKTLRSHRHEIDLFA